ncbi:MAG: N-acetylmuramoyl-L-alanine amidase [Oscillospiraceae bacterium]|nr:N-acetylmuramoyl-L-alanine amidase [Oscillospiraceae bacterium]
MIIKRYISFALALIICFSALPFSVFAEDGGDDVVMSEFTEPIVSHSNFYLPGNMRAVILYPENEYIIEDESVLDEIVKLGMNTVILGTSDAERAYYNTSMNITEEPDYLMDTINSAMKRNLNVFLIFDINTVLHNREEDDDRVPINALITELHKFALKYPCDGIILDNYYSRRDEESFERYMGYGGGIGYTNWLFSSTENYFKTAADIIHLTDNSIPVGIMLNSIWDNSETGTSGDFEAFADGFADTKAFIEDGYADFAMVRALGAFTTSETEPLPFNKVSQWWGEVCIQSGTPMYIIHHNENIGEAKAGWNIEDQLLQQLTYAEGEISAYMGSAFNSYTALLNNKLGTTDTLMKFFDNAINKETLFEELKMLAPTARSYSTQDSIAIFQGTFDENFDVYFNDVKIVLNEAGNFYIEKNLNVGMNYFTIKHKGKEISYSIERKVIPLHDIDASIANGKVLNVEGGTNVNITAIAYKGANVTATLNGQTIKLTEQDASLDNPDLRASYALFSGWIKVPDGIIEQVQDLGTVSVTAQFQNNTRNMIGATVRVNALPKPPPPPEVVKLFDQANAGDGEVVGIIDPIRNSDEAVRYVRLNKDNTIVFAANTTGASFDPDISRQPMGTIDYYRSTVGSYYTTESGKRVSVDDSTLIEGVGMGENSLVVLSGGTSHSGKSNSYFNFSIDKKSSFNIKAADMSYHTAWGDDYNVKEFNARYIYIDFDNVTSVTKLPSFESNLVFSSGRWDTVTVNGIPKFRLILELRQPGVYAGNYSTYNADGTLTISFPVLRNSVAGMNIVIDPGHGYARSATSIDPGAIGHVVEGDVNLAVAKKLKARLEELGANAVRLQTENTFLMTMFRPDYARQFHCDLFISIHCNAVAGNPNARGAEAWYFTPFSQPLAEQVSASIAQYFQNNVYSDGANMNRGAKSSYFWVTTAQDFPSILVELAFVTNYEEAMALHSETHQQGIANAIASGIQKYLSRSNL